MMIGMDKEARGRSRWVAGISVGWISAVAVQGLVLAAALALTALVMDSHNTSGWWSDQHDRTLFWDDVTGVCALLTVLPMVVAVIVRRSTVVLTQLVLVVLVALCLWAVNPNVGVAAWHSKPCPVGVASLTLDGPSCS